MLLRSKIRALCSVGLLLFVAAPTAGAQTLLGAINATRGADGLAPVRPDGTLMRAARAHSLDMLRRDYFGHGAFGPRMSSFGLRVALVGENLAWGVGSSASTSGVIRMWLASPEHRANLLRPGFRRIGIGTVSGSFEGYRGARVVTADFAG